MGPTISLSKETNIFPNTAGPAGLSQLPLPSVIASRLEGMRHGQILIWPLKYCCRVIPLIEGVVGEIHLWLTSGFMRIILLMRLALLIKHWDIRMG